MFEKRITLLVGHFGSGKTEIALNGALDLAADGVDVTLADLDVVKPYFRSRAARAVLEASGVRLLAPVGEHATADLPIIVPQVRQAVRDSSCRLVADIGGDDTGARVLGSLSDVMPPHDTECLAVVNFRRPSTRDAAEAVAMVRAIEATSRQRVTGIVSNTHLMAETTPELVIDGLRMARDAARALDVPVVAVAAEQQVADRLAYEQLGCRLIILRRLVLPPFTRAPRPRTSGPLFVVGERS